jgi:hypothetical protein
MPRWIWENPTPAPRLAHTIIAMWWPWSYYTVTTVPYMGATGNDPLLKLTRLIPGADVRDEYVVQVFKCDRYGTVRYEPRYERCFEKPAQAIENHREVVRLIAQGKLPLKRLFSRQEKSQH